METLALQETLFLNILQNLLQISTVDENSYCIICRSQNDTNTKTDWAEITVNDNKFYRPITYTVGKCTADTTDTIILTNTNLYNLNVASSYLTKPKINQNVLVQDILHDFKPKYARYAEIGIIKSYEKVNDFQIDTCLKNYFTISRYLHYGDVLTIDMNKYAAEIVCSGQNITQNLYFRINLIKGPADDDGGSNCGYFINSKYTTVHQTTSVQCFLPTIGVECNNMNVSVRNIQNVVYNIIPDGFQNITKEIERMILPFLFIQPHEISLSPVFLLCGKSGTGKTSLISAIAKKHGCHYCYINGILIQNSNPAQSETVMKDMFTNISTSAPCILHFRNVEAICEDESGNKDDRTISYFINILKSINSKYPVVVFCTSSNEEKIVPALQRIFLQTVRMENLNSESRKLLLNWILKKACLSYEYVDDIVGLTSNFVFSDLIQLVSRAMTIHVQQFKTEAEFFQNGRFCSLSKTDFLKSVDEMKASYADSIGAPEIPNVTWDDVGGLSELKEEILSSLLTPISSNNLYRSGLLLYGPPGTGKTLLAKAVATECKYNFLSVKGPELLNMYVGQSEKNVRKVFTRARESAPCIIFFDELDSLAPKRGQNGGLGNVMDRVVSQLLTEMDGIQKSVGIFVLAATNRSDLIDPALLRPGRLDKMLYVGTCNDAQSKINVLKALIRKFKLSEDVSIENLVNYLPSHNVTGADLYGICSIAWLNAARQLIKSIDSNVKNESHAVIVTNDDIMLAVSQFES